MPSSKHQMARMLTLPFRTKSAYEGDYQLVKEPLLVAIDFTDIKLA